MSYKITLWNSKMPVTPVTVWWSNFYYHHSTVINKRPLDTIQVNQILKEYKAEYKYESGEIFIEFEDESYASLLILKYS